MQRKSLLAMLGIAGATAAVGATVPMLNAGPSDPVLPNLVSTAPPVSSAYLMEGGFTVQTGSQSEEGVTNRLLLRFDGYVHNVGPGPIDFRGVPRDRTMRQRVQLGDGSWRDAGIPAPGGNNYPLNNDAENLPACNAPNPTAGNAKPATGPCFIFSTTDSVAASDGHYHWHLDGAAAYSLWNAAGTARVGNGQKVGFCLQDSENLDGSEPAPGTQYYGYAPGASSFCNMGNPEGDIPLIEGINAGFRDAYTSNLGWQWIDVSEVPPGNYRLGGQVDPFNRVWETDENNPVAISADSFSVPGWSPNAPAPVSTELGRPVDIALSATAYSSGCKKAPQGGDGGPCSLNYTPSAANRQFVITQAPAAGTITVNGAPVAVGQPFTATTIRYTPNPNVGNTTDTFRVGARDAASAYPLTTPSVPATVQLGRAVPSLAISNAPASVTAGTEYDFNATLLNTTGTLVWSVNGVAGGNATLGTIDANGVYRAPATVPAGGNVVIKATLSSDASVAGQVTVAIVAPVSPGQQLPVPVTPGTPGAPGRKDGTIAKTTKPSLGRPLVARIGKRVVVKVTPNRNGIITTSVFSGRKRVKVCTFRKAIRGRAVLCYVNAGKPGSLRKVRVVVTQRLGTSKSAKVIRATRSVARI